MAETKDINVFKLGTEELTTLLNGSGYQTIFDINKESFTKFEENNSNIPTSDLREIYQLAKQRNENLYMLSKAWQIHNDPIIKGIPKLSSHVGIKGMQSALNRSIGSVSSFEDLFPKRSLKGYAEASSVQSLFSPGRYLSMLYKIARQLLEANSELHIEKRRPDLQSLLLTTDNMNREVSSLDVLIDVLQGGDDDTLSSLENTYYPMTLPYDDHLQQINAVLASHSSNLLKNWDTLLDKQRSSFLQSSATVLQKSRTWWFNAQNKQTSGNPTTPFPSARELLNLTPNTFQLLIDQNATVEKVAKHYNVNVSTSHPNRDLAHSLNVVDNFCKKTGLTFDDLLNLTAQDDYTSLDSEYKSRFIKFGETENVPASTYGAAFLTELETPLWVKQHEGVVTDRRIPEDDAFVRDGTHANSNFGLESELVVKNEISSFHRELYLKFDLSGYFHFVKSAKISLTSVEVGTRDMTHQARLVHDNSWDEHHITWNTRPIGQEIIATWAVPAVGESVEINITEQVNDALATGMKVISIVISASRNYGSTGDMCYGSKENGNQAHRPFIEIKAKGEKSPALNFTEANVVALAGRAEKLVRLKQKTGLTFEQLDWLIQNASMGNQTNIIPLRPHETFEDQDTGTVWRMLVPADDPRGGIGNALIITEFVDYAATRYHSNIGFTLFQSSEIQSLIRSWWNSTLYVGRQMKEMALDYEFQDADGNAIARTSTAAGAGIEVDRGSGSENSAENAVPATTNVPRGHTRPLALGVGTAEPFLLSTSELNEYLPNAEIRRARTELGKIYTDWWIRSPGGPTDVWGDRHTLVGRDGNINTGNGTDRGIVGQGRPGLRPALWVRTMKSEI